MKPYYQDSLCTLYHADFRHVVAAMPATFSPVVIIADPPYAETNLAWDSWVNGWPKFLADFTDSTVQLWCWGSFKMFWDRKSEFDEWRFVQDLVWEKQNGSGLLNDRFRRVHETAVHFRKHEARWEDLYHNPVTTSDATKRTVRRKSQPSHWHSIRDKRYTSEEGGPRLVRSVIAEPNSHRNSLHPTQKPPGVTRYIIQYSCPENGLVFVPFSGSGTELEVAKQEGRKAIGCEINEEYCELAAQRLSQQHLALEKAR